MSAKSIYIPFFYIIQHDISGKMYAGSRTSAYGDANPNQLLVTYFTSSMVVKQMIKNKEGFSVVEIKTFDSKQETYDYEIRFLQENNCAESEQWLNMHDGVNLTPFGSEKYLNALRLKYGDPTIMNSMHVPGTIQKVSENLKGGINCWDEFEQITKRVSTEGYRSDPDRYWHIQSKRYRDKYKGGAKLVKHSIRTLYNIYDADDNLIYERVGKLQQFCEDNDLPFSALRNSAIRNTRVYNGVKNFPKLKKFLKYRGWYAKLLTPIKRKTNC